MKILFALNHPAHYYLFKYIIKGLINNDHKVKIVIREKDVLEKLLKSEKQVYVKLSEKKYRSKNALSVISNGVCELIIQDIRLAIFVKKFKPKLLFGTDIAITHIGRLKKISSFVFNEDDYEINRLFCKLSYPFANHIIAPEYTSVGRHINKKIPYNGIQKMGYLNPKYYIPVFETVKQLGIKPDEPYFIIRIVSLTSGHDIEGNHTGINQDLLRKITARLSKKGKVFISSEDKLSEKFDKYKINIPPNKIHDLMAFASLFIGDSQTMCAEAGILGTPFIRFNDFVGEINYLSDLEDNYKLGWGIKTNNPDKIFDVIEELFSINNFKKEWKLRKEKLFKDKIDLTSFTIWIIENYPESIQILKENPDYQYRFK